MLRTLWTINKHQKISFSSSERLKMSPVNPRKREPSWRLLTKPSLICLVPLAQAEVGDSKSAGRASGRLSYWESLFGLPLTKSLEAKVVRWFVGGI